MEDLASQVGLRTQVSPARWPFVWRGAVGSVWLSEGPTLKMEGNAPSTLPRPRREQRVGLPQHSQNPAFLLDGRIGREEKKKSHLSSSPCNQYSQNPVTLTTLANKLYQPSWPNVTAAPLLVGKAPLLGVLQGPRTRAASPLLPSGGEAQSHVGWGSSRGSGEKIWLWRLHVPFLGMAVPVSTLTIVLLAGHHKPHSGPAGGGDSNR